MDRSFDFPSKRPWLLVTGIAILILLMGFAYSRALQRVRMEQYCVSVADAQVVSLYWTGDISQYDCHPSDD